jgi:hypothetical protein
MIKFYEPSSAITILGSTYNKGDVLLFKDVPLVTAETNKNRDIISEVNAAEIAETTALKPISLEHKHGKMAGIFTEARYVAPHVLTSGLIYRKHLPDGVVKDLLEGKFFLSVEAAASKAACTNCGETFADQSDYCNHLKAKKIYNSYRKFPESMWGTGGALVREPAGSKTSIASSSISVVASYDTDEFEGREFSADERSKLAKSKAALPDGSFPIVNGEDLHNAIRAVGRASNEASAKAHIISRAKALGLTAELPGDWVKGAQMTEKSKAEAEQRAPSAEENKDESKVSDKSVDDMKADVAKLESDLKATVARAEAAELKAKAYEDSAADKKQDKGNPGEDSPKDKKEDKAGQDALDKKEMKAKIEELEAKLGTAIEKRRYDMLVTSGVLTEDEWKKDKDSLMKSEDVAIELLASKAQPPAQNRKIMIQGGVQNAVKENQTPKRQLVFG